MTVTGSSVCIIFLTMGSVEPKIDSNDHDPLPSPPVYTVLSEKKIFTMLIATSVNFLSPVSADIYYPALGSVAKDLNVSQSKLNLTITSYMVRSSSRYRTDDTDIGIDT